MIFFTVLILITMVIVVVITLCCSCCTLSEKNKTRIADFKNMVFFSMPIRYTMVNCLKLNLSSLMVLKVAYEPSWSQILVASLILAAINCVPIFFARLIWKKFDILDT